MTGLAQLGVRGRLLLAFFGISGFAVIAAMAAMYAFSKAGEVLEQITQQRLPPVLSSLELSRQAERIVGAAPALLTVSSQTEREATYARVADEVAELLDLLGQLEEHDGEARDVISVRIAPLVLGFEGNLDDLDFLVEQRLDIAARQGELLEQFTRSLEGARHLLAPAAQALDATLADWAGGSDLSNAPSLPAGEATDQDLAPLLTQRKVELLIADIDDAFLRTALAGSTGELPWLSTPFEVSLDELQTVIAWLPDDLAGPLRGHVATLEDLYTGGEGLIDTRRAERDVLDRAARVLADNEQLAQQLTVAVDRLVQSSKADIRLASLEALQAQNASSGVLIVVIVFSLLSSGLIVWLYVDRNLVARLTGLSDSMLAIAGGDLRALLPAVGSRDEIGRMAEALIVFRDNAIVLEENNLREISQARQRLIDAIESISEGFVFFDADDRLELCNSRYRDLLHAGRDPLVPGTPFETIVRNAASEGAIADAAGDEEAWIAERLARHRNPGEPHVQRRADGRWIRISERQTAAGGFVAVYTDITELMKREAALAEERERLAEVTARLSLALSMDGVGIWDVDLIKDEVWWSREYTVMLGHDPATYVPTASAWEEHLHPEEARRIIDEVEAFLARRDDTLRLTQRLITGDGREMWTEALMRAQRDDEGKALRLAGLDVDITVQLEREHQLQQANQQISEAAAEIERKNQTLEALSSKLAKYLSPQVYDSIFSGRQEVTIASQRKKLTVFFSDIAGFTETTDRLQSEELTQLLNQYLTEMSRVASEHGATIDKYVGDAIMIFFGDPESQGAKADALACVKMAIAMQKRLQKLAELWRDAGIERPLQCRIGINTGYCTVGNFGSEDRMDYTIIGSGVNLASRLEHVAPPGGILISFETYALVKDEVHCEERGHIEVKGIAYPVATYEVIDLHGNLVKAGRAIQEQLPHLRLDLDLGAMSPAERQIAAGVLQRTLDRLTALEPAADAPLAG